MILSSVSPLKRVWRILGLISIQAPLNASSLPSLSPLGDIQKYVRNKRGSKNQQILHTSSTENVDDGGGGCLKFQKNCGRTEWKLPSNFPTHLEPPLSLSRPAENPLLIYYANGVEGRYRQREEMKLALSSIPQ